MGPRGLTVLSLAGITALIFGLTGWRQRDSGLVAQPPQLPAATSSPTAASSPAAASPSATSSATASAAPAPSATAGPPLASEPYASYSYLVWPGPVSANGRLALAGFSLTVTRKAGGITVNAIQDGEKMTSASHFYAGGAKVYVIDSNLGDEGGSTDYNTADDGLIVTNAQGRVLG